MQETLSSLRAERAEALAGEKAALERAAAALDERAERAQQVAELKDLARKLECELWLSSLLHREDESDPSGVPERVARFEKDLSVLLRLRSAEDHVRLELVKDHDNGDVADLHIELDPKSLLLNWR